METLSNFATSARKSVWGETAAEKTTAAQEAAAAPEENTTPQETTAPEPITEEPPAGETGSGTATEPYDGGNAPEQEAANKEINPPEISPAAADTTTSGPISALENATEKPLISNARMPSFAKKETNTGTIVDPSSEPSVTAKEEKGSAHGLRDEETSPDLVKELEKEPTKAIGESQIKKNEAYSPFENKDTSSGTDEPSLRTPRHESADRSISPGTRTDGSHVETGKTEKTKLSSKLKGKFHIGSSKH